MLNEARKLPELFEDDPRNLLPREARLRIDRAHFEQLAMKDAAIAKILARGSGNPREWDAEACELWSDTNMQRAYTVLSVEIQEFSRIGKSGRELEDIIRGELESMTYSLEMSQVEQNAVWLRLLLVPAQPDSEKVVEIAAGRQIANDPLFGTPELRAAAIDACKKIQDPATVDKVAQHCEVEYSDLNKWKKRGHAAFSKKGYSVKAERIEKALRSFVEPSTEV